MPLTHHEQMMALRPGLRVAYVLMGDNYALTHDERVRLNVVGIHGTDEEIQAALDDICAAQLARQRAGYTLEQRRAIWAKQAKIKAAQHRKRRARRAA